MVPGIFLVSPKTTTYDSGIVNILRSFMDDVVGLTPYFSPPTISAQPFLHTHARDSQQLFLSSGRPLLHPVQGGFTVDGVACFEHAEDSLHSP